MSTAGDTLQGHDGRHLAVGDRVSGTIRSGRHIEGVITHLVMPKKVVIVLNENEPDGPYHRSGKSYRFTKQ